MDSSSGCDKPQWLTPEYVQEILKKYLKVTNVKVECLEVKPATGKGESYSSIINRVRAVYRIVGLSEPEEISFLVKTTFENDAYLASVLQKYDVLNTEMEMYEHILPEMQKLLQNIGDEDQLFASTLYVDHERKAIFFEDLSVKGFVMADRTVGLDELHMRLCLRKLAKFHATAAVLNDRLQGSLQKYQRGIFNRHVNEYGQFFERVSRVCADYCAVCPELGVYYRDKIRRLVPHLVEKAIECYDPKANHFLTLNHGDMWTNNVMMQYNLAECDDVLLIDFQYCSWTSPAIDLHYFFNTSMQDDSLFNHQDRFIQYYHGVLSETLRKLNFERHIPTLHELQVQLLERGFKRVTTLLVNLPLMINDKTEDADVMCILKDSERSKRFCRILYTNERVQRIMKIMLPRLDRLGLFDVNE